MPSTASFPPEPLLADTLDAALPQTQCTRCGYPDCRGYAEAMASGAADINRCPPGGAEGIVRLSALTGRPAVALDTGCGVEGPRGLAVIDEAWCIGCTLCIKACPVDCIIGAPKLMHTVVDAACTGCELCIPACPVDCIAMVAVTPDRTGWAAWGTEEAETARERYAFHRHRVQREKAENEARLAAAAEAKLANLAAASRIVDPAVLAAKRAVIDAALRRAREQRGPAIKATPAGGENSPDEA